MTKTNNKHVPQELIGRLYQPKSHKRRMLTNSPAYLHRQKRGLVFVRIFRTLVANPRAAPGSVSELEMRKIVGTDARGGSRG